jgi:hypothetical protein
MVPAAARRNLNSAPPQTLARNGKKLVLESQFNQVLQTLRAVGGMTGGFDWSSLTNTALYNAGLTPKRI